MFEYRSDAELGARVYLLNPNTMKTMKDIEEAERSALHGIERLQNAINKIGEYRMMLYERVKVLQTANYKRILKLVRDPNWSGKKYYNVSIVKDYGGDIGEVRESHERYVGAERAKAFKRFSELKKQNPGIEVFQDTEKRTWEK